jgi:hypothetical protein
LSSNRISATSSPLLLRRMIFFIDTSRKLS